MLIYVGLRYGKSNDGGFFEDLWISLLYWKIEQDMDMFFNGEVLPTWWKQKKDWNFQISEWIVIQSGAPNDSEVGANNSNLSMVYGTYTLYNYDSYWGL